ncbi:hypothetical protein FOZ60_007396 [Perkinsus olseni]|uniref:N-acetyltransferase domain-containing protein n=1 Tax=Perkinsus olseni TaxID=32597 RepID=A0A7J6NLE6_PEROL|nr:hypothetical protein FOZ60_007396 [Perkinsus olseni]
MLSLVHVAVLLLPMVVGHLPSPVTQIGGENLLRSLSGDITYRNYRPGDDLSLIGRQAVEFCKDNICYVAVDLKSVGQKLKVADAYRGRGIATEMLSHTFAVLEQTHPKLISVYLHVDSDNLPAIRLYEKSGFEKIASPSSKVFLFARHM